MGQFVEVNNQVSLGTVIHLITLVFTIGAFYWGMRELVFKLHHENKERMATIERTMATMNSKLDLMYEWWTTFMERRDK